MQTRYRAAATALLLTATTGLAATGARSGLRYAPSRRSRGEQARRDHQDQGHGVKLSESKIRPGNTMFKVKNAGGPPGSSRSFGSSPATA